MMASKSWSKWFFFGCILIAIISRNINHCKEIEDDDYSDKEADEDYETTTKLPPTTTISSSKSAPSETSVVELLTKNKTAFEIITKPDASESETSRSTTEKPKEDENYDDEYYDDGEYGDTATTEPPDVKNDPDREAAFRGIGSGIRHLFQVLSRFQYTMSGAHGVPNYGHIARVLRANVQEVLDEVIKGVLPIILQSTETGINISPKCISSQIRFLHALRAFEPWAIRMLDSSGKLPEGIFSGTLSSLGVYDACVALEIPKMVEDDLPVEKGQYCAIDIAPIMPPRYIDYLPEDIFREAAEIFGFDENDVIFRTLGYFYFLKFRIGFCVPSACGTEDMKAIAVSVSEFLRVNITVKRCEKETPIQVEGYPLFAIQILAVAVFILVGATVIDLFQRILHDIYGTPPSRGRFLRVCHCISVYNNLHRLVNWTKPINDERNFASLDCIHGLRFIAMLWIILGNTYRFFDLQVISGLVMAKDIAAPLLFQIVPSATFALDTLLFITCFSCSYLIYEELKVAIQPFNLFKVYALKLWQTLPPYFTILLIVPIIPLLGSGPLWHDTVNPFVEKCQTSFWANLLFVNNYFRPENQCMFTSWFIALEMQYFFLVPILTWLMFNARKVALSILGAITVVSFGLTFLITYAYHLPPIKIFTDLDPHSFSEISFRINQMPFTHYGALVVGVLLGCAISEYRDKLYLSRIRAAFGYCVAVGLMLFVIFAPYHWQNGDMASPVIGAGYAAICRLLWVIAIGWIIMVCATGQGGLTNKVLGFAAFRPVSEVTLSAFLINPLLMLAFAGCARQPVYFAHIVAIYIFVAHSVATYFFSFILHIGYQMPFVAITKQFFCQQTQLKLQHPPHHLLKAVDSPSPQPTPDHKKIANLFQNLNGSPSYLIPVETSNDKKDDTPSTSSATCSFHSSSEDNCVQENSENHQMGEGQIQNQSQSPSSLTRL